MHELEPNTSPISTLLFMATRSAHTQKARNADPGAYHPARAAGHCYKAGPVGCGLAASDMSRAAVCIPQASQGHAASRVRWPLPSGADTGHRSDDLIARPPVGSAPPVSPTLAGSVQHSSLKWSDAPCTTFQTAGPSLIPRYCTAACPQAGSCAPNVCTTNTTMPDFGHVQRP